LKIDDFHLAALPLDIGDHALNSKWGTRGWAYQEAVLSPRRLIFTDQGVVWNCNKKYCEEALTEDQLQHGARIFPEWTNPSSSRWTLLYHVHNFLKRELTFQHDRLNAMSGIFRS